jgi:signal recognition particle receptor subunit beta
MEPPSRKEPVNGPKSVIDLLQESGFDILRQPSEGRVLSMQDAAKLICSRQYSSLTVSLEVKDVELKFKDMLTFCQFALLAECDAKVLPKLLSSVDFTGSDLGSVFSFIKAYMCLGRKRSGFEVVLFLYLTLRTASKDCVPCLTFTNAIGEGNKYCVSDSVAINVLMMLDAGLSVKCEIKEETFDFVSGSQAMETSQLSAHLEFLKQNVSFEAGLTAFDRVVLSSCKESKDISKQITEEAMLNSFKINPLLSEYSRKKVTNFGPSFYFFFVFLSQVLILGLECSGKSTLMALLHENALKQHSPTRIPRTVDITFNKWHIRSFDLGGHVEARRLWKDYFAQTDAVIYLVDAINEDLIPEAKKVLDGLLSDPDLDACPFLILGNKNDMDTCINEARLKELLGLPRPSDVSEIHYKNIV